MITYEPLFPENILGMDLANLDSKSENFTFDYYLGYFLKYPCEFFSANSYCIYKDKTTHMIYTNPVIGYIFGKKEFKERLCLHLSALSIAPSYRKFGLGSQLMLMFENNGNEMKAYFADLFVRQTNCVAISFYKKLGYKIYRTIFNYYCSPLENAFDMRKSLEADTDKMCEIKGKDIYDHEL